MMNNRPDLSYNCDGGYPDLAMIDDELKAVYKENQERLDKVYEELTELLEGSYKYVHVLYVWYNKCRIPRLMQGIIVHDRCYSYSAQARGLLACRVVYTFRPI